jgi:hypothetical protein
MDEKLPIGTTRSLMDWLRAVAGCTWPPAADEKEDDGDEAERGSLRTVQPGPVAPMQVRPAGDGDPDPAAEAAVPTPKDLESMGRTEAQAEQFHRLLRANSAKPGDAGDQELLALAKAVGWLHTTKCLPALQAVLAGIAMRDAAGRPALITALAEQLPMFPPQDQDYDEPTSDQVAALEALLQAMVDHVAPGQWPEVMPSLREALGAACGGMDYLYMDTPLEEAVARTKSGPRDMTPFLKRLDDLAPPPHHSG